MAVTVKLRRGIGEDPRRNMMSALTDQLDKSRFFIDGEADWTAEFGPVPRPTGRAYTHGVRAAAVTLADEIREHNDGPLIVGGFSAGAAVVNTALRMLSYRERQAKVTRAILVADPAMPASTRLDQLVGTRRPNSSGITGGKSIWTPDGSRMLTWVAHQGDAICCCPLLSPLRTMADQLTGMSLSDLGGWGADLHTKLVTRAFQPTNVLGLSEALWDLDGYVRRGEHVRHYPPMLAQLGAQLNKEYR
ncbi:hypothetical protein ACTHQY_15060 [Rhodococcoides corynebacterioides]|uniref:hypothetical protein n=1 Tax=Rhodococcoides corynebacterioides TaxID=53972 RepID=UPI003F7FFE70